MYSELFLGYSKTISVAQSRKFTKVSGIIPVDNISIVIILSIFHTSLIYFTEFTIYQFCSA
jgi:hypothetical protein